MKVIILAGGSGTRLWPISRTYYPKQFLKLKESKYSLFQKTVERCLQMTSIDEIYVVTNQSYKFLVMGQVEELGFEYNEKNILIEPSAKNTLPAIYYGVQEIRKKGEDIIAVFPSDHMILQEEKFVDIIKSGTKIAKDNIITYGVTPDSPHTGYGYIKPGQNLDVGFRVEQFREKPSYDTAVEYVRDGYLWNGGMFMFDSLLFVEETRKHCEGVFNAFEGNTIEKAFEVTPKISIDYGIMEKSDKVATIALDAGWKDLGSFDTFHEIYPKDEAGNIKFKDDILIDSRENLVYCENEKTVALIGVEDLIVVDEKDALLICDRKNAQKVKDVVDTLKARKSSTADYHVVEYRPWGVYRILENADTYKIKRITVFPNKRLSYQLHHHRSEHWVVVKGMAKVVVEGEEKFVRTGESIFVPSGFKHRLENPGKITLELIEVQIGDYLEEDDIIRFTDDFGRS